MKYSDLNLDPNLLKGIHEAGFTDCMPVQEETFPHSFARKDVYVQSQTGSGKSAAFLISIFHLFLQKEAKTKKALIIAPTRELAVQISREAHLLGKYLDFSIGVFYGGVGYEKQEQSLRDGVNLIIGTPGRIIDLNQTGTLNLNDIEVLVIDEADRLFDMGFLPDIRKMLKKMPTYPDRQTMLFSATLNLDVRNVARDYMYEPAEVEIDPDQVTVENIIQKIYHVGRHEKLSLLIGIMQEYQPKNALIFTNTKRMAERVAETMRVNGFPCQFIMGDLPQAKRIKIIDDVKAGKVAYLIATDVAARGLHINDLELVINYDLPENCENYVHRIGRTARVGKTGTAISLVCEQFVYGLEAIESYINVKIPIEHAEDHLYAKIKHPHRAPSDDDRRDRSNRGERGRRREKEKRGAYPERHAASGQAAKSGSDHDRHPSRKHPSTKSTKHGSAKAGTGPEKNHTRHHHDSKSKKHDGVKPAARAVPMDKKKTKKVEDRLKYYSEKYGENFTVKHDDAASKPKRHKKKKSLIQKIISVFKRKK